MEAPIDFFTPAKKLGKLIHTLSLHLETYCTSSKNQSNEKINSIITKGNCIQPFPLFFFIFPVKLPQNDNQPDTCLSYKNNLISMNKKTQREAISFNFFPVRYHMKTQKYAIPSRLFIKYVLTFSTQHVCQVLGSRCQTPNSS